MFFHNNKKSVTGFQLTVVKILLTVSVIQTEKPKTDSNPKTEN